MLVLAWEPAELAPTLEVQDVGVGPATRFVR